MSVDLTIVLPVRNEEATLGICLNAIGKDFARDIVVIDSGSTDRTVAIATEYGARCLNFYWNGKFPKKRNWFLREHTPKTKWVLFLDADEILSDEWKNEVRGALNAPHPPSGFWLNYTIHFMGRPLKGGYPLRKLALFQVGAGEYERIEENHWSDLDMEVHEHPILSGPVGRIRTRIDHRDDRGVTHWMKKHLAYTQWEAGRFMRAQEEKKIRKQWTCRQKIKYALLPTPLVAFIYFFGSYFLYLGIRDGHRGLTFSLLKASYFLQVHALIKEQLRTQTKP